MSYKALTCCLGMIIPSRCPVLFSNYVVINLLFLVGKLLKGINGCDINRHSLNDFFIETPERETLLFLDFGEFCLFLLW